MPNPTIEKELHAQLDRLSEADQQQVLELAQRLVERTEKGVTGASLLRFVGLIPSEDLEEMKRAIDEECSRIDPDGW